MIYRKHDADGDYTFGAGNDNTFLEGIDAVGQAIQTKLGLFKGEWWENENEGLPLLQEILGVRGADQHNAELLIVQRIKETPEVLGVSQVTSEYDPTDRTYSFLAEVSTTYGQLALQNEGGV